MRKQACKLICPHCRQKTNGRVSNSRYSNDGLTINRRRNCHLCKGRWTTYERQDPTEIFSAELLEAFKQATGLTYQIGLLLPNSRRQNKPSAEEAG